MSTQKNAVVISASPKTTGDSVSGWLGAHAREIMADGSLHVQHIDVRECCAKDKTAEAYASMSDADALVFIFPLYVFCLPGILTRFLQDYNDDLRALQKTTKKSFVYAVVNCGFPEPEINEEAVRVIKSFSEKICASFRFGVMIGGGGMLLGAQGSPMVKKMMAGIDGAFNRMKNEIVNGQPESGENVLVYTGFPKRLYFLSGSLGWTSSARKYHLKKKDLYARPYL